MDDHEEFSSKKNPFLHINEEIIYFDGAATMNVHFHKSRSKETKFSISKQFYTDFFFGFSLSNQRQLIFGPKKIFIGRTTLSVVKV